MPDATTQILSLSKDLRNRRLPSRGYFVIGHRGASAHAPDNSLLAITRGAQYGADLVELDLRMTKDGVLVLAHAPYLVDSAGSVLPVAERTLAQLRKVDLGEGERMLTLDEALDQCRSLGIGIYLEIVDGRALPKTIGTLSDRGWFESVTLASFRPDWLSVARQLAPDAVTAISFAATGIDPVKLAQSCGASYVQPSWENLDDPSSLLTEDWLDHVREAGLGIVSWHEERTEQIDRLKQMGLDAISTDAPDLF